MKQKEEYKQETIKAKNKKNKLKQNNKKMTKQNELGGDTIPQVCGVFWSALEHHRAFGVR